MALCTMRYALQAKAMRNIAAILVFAAAVQAVGQSAASGPVSIQVDLAKPIGVYKPISSWFGYDESNYTTMKYGEQLLSELHDLSPVPVYIRAHHLAHFGQRRAGAQVELVERVQPRQERKARLRLHDHRPDLR